MLYVHRNHRLIRAGVGSAGPTNYINTDCGFGEFAEFRSCVEVEVVVLGSPSLIVRTVPVDVKQH